MTDKGPKILAYIIKALSEGGEVEYETVLETAEFYDAKERAIDVGKRLKRLYPRCRIVCDVKVEANTEAECLSLVSKAMDGRTPTSITKVSD